MKHTLILANGTPPTKKLLLQHIQTSDYFVCADGGANIAAQFGVRPNFIIGDLDSIKSNTIKQFKSVPTQLIKDQYSTDLEKALTYVIRQKYTEIVVLGADGGRIDHSIGNLSALIKYSRKANISFVMKNGILLPVTRERVLDIPIGTIVSLIPLTLCEGIITSGLKWNLKNESLCLGKRESTSNLATSSPVKIQIRQGNLIVFVAKLKSLSRKVKETVRN
jgi:thiamine pyrophosphokinase